MHNLPPQTLRKFKDRLIDGAHQLNIRLSDEQADQMAHHAELLLAWNKKINLTAIKEPLAVAEKHFVDCLEACSLFGGDDVVMDVGSGGGFPGIPLKIMTPSLSVLLVDSSRKKVNFLKQIIRELKLQKIDAIHSRVEDLHANPRYAGQFDGVISRAFAQLAGFVDLALPFLKNDGRIHAMKGRHSSEEITPEVSARFDIIDHTYCLPFEKSERHILSLSVKP